MSKNSKFWGAIFLISGTTLGAGTLALPLTTGQMGFSGACALFFLCWLYFFCTALLFVEVQFYVKEKANLVSLATKTLGTPGKIVSWSAYLLLLYCLTAAYISGCAGLLESLFSSWITIPFFVYPVVTCFSFGALVYLGTKVVDFTNRILFTGLCFSFLLLCIKLLGQVNPSFLFYQDNQKALLALPVIIASFGFHIVIPTLVQYLQYKKSLIRWALFWGSVISLLVYVIWEYLVLGSIPVHGKHGLMETLNQNVSLISSLYLITKSSFLYSSGVLFSFFVIITSFLGVSLSLSHFLADGLKLTTTKKDRIKGFFYTFIPPLLFTLFYPKGFVLALEYAAIFIAVLLGILPAAMVWALPKKRNVLYSRVLLSTIIIISVGIIGVDIFA